MYEIKTILLPKHDIYVSYNYNRNGYIVISSNVGNVNVRSQIMYLYYELAEAISKHIYDTYKINVSQKTIQKIINK